MVRFLDENKSFQKVVSSNPTESNMILLLKFIKLYILNIAEPGRDEAG